MSKSKEEYLETLTDFCMDFILAIQKKGELHRQDIKNALTQLDRIETDYREEDGGRDTTFVQYFLLFC